MRRSLTITAENDKKVQLARGLFLNDAEAPIDVDYTTMVNFFIELGHKLFYSMKKDDTQITVVKNEVNNILSKYIMGSELKDEAVVDQFTDVFYKKLLEQLQKTTMQATDQKSVPELTNQRSNSSSSNKSPEYVS
ncbi:MAG: hypothetical protein ABSD92_06990 [Candidatus Bathyarchaeia archaeon]|jgi:hypothetical protein